MSVYLLLIAVLAAGNIEASETCGKKLDLLLLVDGSSTICGGTGQEVPPPCREWYAILEFCKNIVNSLNIGSDETRVAFITYSDKTQVEWDLTRYTDKTSLLSAIDNVKYTGGEFTDLVSAVKVITDVFFPLGKKDRLDVQSIGILITDGAPAYPDEVYAGESATVQANGVGVFVVCLRPGCSKHYAQCMSSPPKNVNETHFHVHDHLLIDQVRDNLVKKFCAWTLPQGIVDWVKDPNLVCPPEIPVVG